MPLVILTLWMQQHHSATTSPHQRATDVSSLVLNLTQAPVVVAENQRRDVKEAPVVVPTELLVTLFASLDGTPIPPVIYHGGVLCYIVLYCIVLLQCSNILPFLNMIRQL